MSRSPMRISPVMRVRRGSCSPNIANAVTLLPEPDSPTMPSVRPRSTAKTHPADGVHHAVLGVEPHGQITDLEIGRHVRIHVNKPGAASESGRTGSVRDSGCMT